MAEDDLDDWRKRNHEQLRKLEEAQAEIRRINARLDERWHRRHNPMSEPRDDLPWAKEIMNMSMKELQVKVAELELKFYTASDDLKRIRKRLDELGFGDAGGTK